MPSQADILRQQLADLQREYNASQQRGMRRTNDNNGYADFMRRQFALNEQIVRAEQQASQAASASAAGGDGGSPEANRRELFDLARGRAGELRNDTVDQEVLAALRERSGAGAGPYDATTINALLGGATEQAQQVERNALARVQGGAGDPSTQSQIAEAQAARQAAVQRARLSINQNANVANYGARGQALGQLGSFNSGRNAAITDADRYVAQLLAAEQFTEQTGGAAPAGGGGMSYSTASGGGGGSRQPAPAPAPRPAPVQRPAYDGMAVAPNQPGRVYNVGRQPFQQTSGSLATKGGTYSGGSGNAGASKPVPQYGTATNLRTGQTMQVQNQRYVPPKSAVSVTPVQIPADQQASPLTAQQLAQMRARK